MSRVLGRFNKKKEVNDPELEAAIRERLYQDITHAAVQKAAEVETWDRIRDRGEPTGT